MAAAATYKPTPELSLKRKDREPNPAERAVLELKHLVKTAPTSSTEAVVQVDDLNVSDDWDRCFGSTVTASQGEREHDELEKYLGW